jgi:hypothetical protein
VVHVLPETDLRAGGGGLPHDRFGEYLAQPNLTWRPTKYFFVQFGAGYYEVGGRGQASFMCRVNLLNPTQRRTRDADE